MEVPFVIRTGTVVASLPYLDAYSVKVTGDPHGMDFAVALHSSGTSERLGHRSQEGYVSGTFVLLLCPQRGSTENFALHLPKIILGAVTQLPQVGRDGEEVTYGPAELLAGAMWDFNTNPAVEALLNSDRVPLFRQDRSYNRLLDIGAADWAKNNVLGGHFFLSDFMASMGAAEGCHIRSYYLDRLLEISADTLRTTTPTLRESFLMRGQNSLNLQGIARSSVEGAGGLTTAPFLQEEQNGVIVLVPVDEAQRSFYRLERMNGGVVDGEWSFNNLPPPDQEVYTGDVLPVRLWSTQYRNDGVVKIKAAKGLELHKTVAIRAPVELTEVETAPYQPQELEAPTEEIWETLGFQSEDDLRKFLPYVYPEIEDEQDLNRLFTDLRKEGEVWRLPTRQEIHEAIQLPDTEGEPSSPIPPLPNTQQEYTLEELAAASVDMEWKAGQMVKIFKNSSAFLMADDGGISINDGFGGMIRLHRGNLIITVPGDIEINPGRDLKQRAGRNLLMQALKSVEIAAETGSIKAKAETNFHTLANKGSLTLESRGETKSRNDLTAEKLQEDAEHGGGVVVKSTKADVSILASSALYMGPYSGKSDQDPNKGGRPENLGVQIIIDSGNERLYMNADSLDLWAKRLATMGLTDQLCMLHLSPGQLAHIVNGANTFMGYSVDLTRGSGSISVPELGPNGVKEKSQRLPTQNTALRVAGVVQIDDQLQVASDVVSTGQVVANGGCNQDPLTGRDRVNIQINDGASEVRQFRNSVQSQLRTIVQSVESLVKAGIMSSYGQLATDFAFPSSIQRYVQAGTTEQIQFPWQTLLTEGTPWIDQVVSHSIIAEGTRPYPGLEAEKAWFRSIEGGRPAEDLEPMTAYTTNWQNEE